VLPEATKPERLAPEREHPILKHAKHAATEDVFTFVSSESIRPVPTAMDYPLTIPKLAQVAGMEEISSFVPSEVTKPDRAMELRTPIHKYARLAVTVVIATLVLVEATNPVLLALAREPWTRKLAKFARILFLEGINVLWVATP